MITHGNKEVLNMITKNIENGVETSQRRVGRRVENGSDIRLGALGRLDKMAWGEFRLLPVSKQERRMGQARSEKKIIGKLEADDANARMALAKNGINIETAIYKYSKNLDLGSSNQYKQAYYPDQNAYKQISVTLDIPALSNKSVAIRGKPHKYRIEEWFGVVVDNMAMLDLDRFGFPDEKSSPMYKTVYRKTKDTLVHKHDLLGVMLTGISINGKVLAGVIKKNTMLDFFKKLFGDSQHVIEVGCCAIAEEGGRIRLHYEKLLVRLPKNESTWL